MQVRRQKRSFSSTSTSVNGRGERGMWLPNWIPQALAAQPSLLGLRLRSTIAIRCERGSEKRQPHGYERVFATETNYQTLDGR